MNLDLTVGQRVNEDTDDPSKLQRIWAPRDNDGTNGDPDNRWRLDPLLATQVVCYWSIQDILSEMQDAINIEMWLVCDYLMWSFCKH